MHASLKTVSLSLLVVDDESDIVSSLRMYLAAHLPGVEVLEASGAEEALDVARRQKVDLVLTDYLMPDMDGLELLGAWKRIQDSKAILLTAYPDASVMARAVGQHHVAAVLIKPVDPWQIALTVAKHLGITAMPPWQAGEGVAA